MVPRISRLVLASTLLVGALLATVGCDGGKAPAPPGSIEGPGKPAEGTGKGQDTAEPAFKGKGADLYAEFKSDKDAALKKYQNKVVEVDAVITEFPTLKEDENVALAVDRQAKESPLVCTLTPEGRQKLRELAKGQEVKVRGKVYLAIIGHVYLQDCTFPSVGPSPAKKVTAKELAAEFAKDDGEPASKKYGE